MRKKKPVDAVPPLQKRRSYVRSQCRASNYLHHDLTRRRRQKAC